MFANNKGADQPAHTHSQIRAFVIRLLKISYLDLPVAEETGLSRDLSETPKIGFVATRPKYCCNYRFSEDHFCLIV